MKPVSREEWLEALESGKYKQTQHWLHRTKPIENTDEPAPVGYCCLGVLCELADLQYDEQAQGYYEVGEEGRSLTWTGMPPITLAEPLFDDPQDVQEAAKLNDEGYTFEQIAEHFRDKWNMPKKEQGEEQ